MATKTKPLSNEDVRPRMQVVVVEEAADASETPEATPPLTSVTKSKPVETTPQPTRKKPATEPGSHHDKPADTKTESTTQQPAPKNKTRPAPAPLPSSGASDLPISKQEEDQQVQFRYGLIAFVFLILILIVIVLMVSGLNG